MIHFPLFKACRASGTVSKEHAGCWSPNSWAFLPPTSLCGLVMEPLSPLRVESDAKICASQERYQRKLLLKPACHKTTARPGTSLCSLLHIVDLCCQVLKPCLAFQPLQPQTCVTGVIWHYVSVQAPGTKNRRDKPKLRKQEANKYPEKILISVIKLVSLFYKVRAALLIFTEFDLNCNGSRQ